MVSKFIIYVHCTNAVILGSSLFYSVIIIIDVYVCVCLCLHACNFEIHYM